MGVDIGEYGINEWTSPWIDDPVVGRLGSWAYAGSMHVGRCHVTLADGSVHFLDELTDWFVLRQLAAMADGDVLSFP